MQHIDYSPKYVMSYFKIEAEQLFLASSSDGTQFSPIHGEASLLRSTVGSLSIRDPFIGRGPDKRFHLVATDGWESRFLLHSVSDDLLHWSPVTTIPIMSSVENVLNVWAPEFFTVSGDRVRLMWSSTVTAERPPRDVRHQIEWDKVDAPQQIWECSTADFVSFTSPSLFFSPGYTVIDASVYVDDDFAILSFKDERGSNHKDSGYKNIRLCNIDSQSFPIGHSRLAGSRHLVEGPNIYRVGRELRLIFDEFLIGAYGCLGSTDGEDWYEVELQLPEGVKHASVLQLTEDESMSLGMLLAVEP